ncbi:MAG: class I adenylate-forming enzyme family protein [Xanthobacteraceae bacterium]
MILGDPAVSAADGAYGLGRITVSELFHYAAWRRPDALALADPANRSQFTEGKPRRLSYAEADRVVAAIAARLRGMGLSTDAVIGIQLPNVVENILAILGVLRAGMIAAPLPLLWRRADAVAALARVGAKALIVCGRVGTSEHCQFAMQTAAEVFSIRYVCAFGTNLPDGVVSFEDLFSEIPSGRLLPLDRARENAASHVAAVTFDVGENGLVPVARTHSELFAGGLAAILESRLPPEANILSALLPASFAGLSLMLLPWLFSGGTLFLHHPFDPDLLAWQWREDRCTTLVLPGAVAMRLGAAGAFAAEAPRAIIAPWREPQALMQSGIWRAPRTALTDVAVFGEAALAPARRGSSGRPEPLNSGPVAAPRDHSGAVTLAELIRTAQGTLAVRGPMVPHHAYPPGVERSGLPYFTIGHDGTVDTRQRFATQPGTETVVLNGVPSGVAGIGGYRFALLGLEEAVRRIDPQARLSPVADPVMGQRLIGTAVDPKAMKAALDASGANPLVGAAFAAAIARAVRDPSADAA